MPVEFPNVPSYHTVTDRGRPVRLPQFARLSPNEPIRGRYQSGRRRHIPVVPRRRTLPTRGPAPVWCLYRRRRPPLRSEERDAHHPLLFPTLLHLMTPPVRFPIELIRLLSVGLVVFSLRIGIYLPHKSGWTSPVERVRLNESGWTSPVERVRFNESGWTSSVERVRLNESCWTSPVERVRLNETGWMSPSLVTPTADPVRWPPVCGSQRSADPLTVGHTVRVSHRLWTPSADHLSADHNVRQTHWLWVTPFAYRTDRGSPLTITFLILTRMITPLIFPIFKFLISLLCRINWHRPRRRPGS